MVILKQFNDVVTFGPVGQGSQFMVTGLQCRLMWVALSVPDFNFPNLAGLDLGGFTNSNPAGTGTGARFRSEKNYHT